MCQYLYIKSYPEWPHRHDAWLPRMLKVAMLQDRIPDVAELHRFILCTCAQGVLPMREGGATSQLNLSSLTPFSVAGLGRLQLGVPHGAT